MNYKVISHVMTLKDPKLIMASERSQSEKNGLL